MPRLIAISISIASYRDKIYPKPPWKEQILIIIKKCEFFIKKTNFIRFIIKLEQLRIDLKKIKAIID